MPGFDGRGPEGRGPMTGGGRGYCAVPVNDNVQRPRFGTGMRFGMGRGRGCGRGGGRGWRNQYYATGLTGWQRAQQGPDQNNNNQ